MSELLTHEQVERALKKLDVEWSVVGDVSLERVFEFEDFKTALDFVNKVGRLAEKMNHHPDIELSWGKVVVKLTTHSANGLTRQDFEFAENL